MWIIELLLKIIISLVPPPISINIDPNFFSLISKTDADDAKGSIIKPSISNPHSSIHVFKSFSIFLAIVTKWTFASNLFPDNPSGFLMPCLSSTLNSLDKVWRIFLSGDKLIALECSKTLSICFCVILSPAGFL